MNSGYTGRPDLSYFELVLPWNVRWPRSASGWRRPPRTVVLVVPPGTGKTTFARAVASRLCWAFIEVFPWQLAAEPHGVAAGLRCSSSPGSTTCNRSCCSSTMRRRPPPSGVIRPHWPTA